MAAQLPHGLSIFREDGGVLAVVLLRAHRGVDRL
jgi:hypothetical protein